MVVVFEQAVLDMVVKSASGFWMVGYDAVSVLR